MKSQEFKYGRDNFNINEEIAMIKKRLIIQPPSAPIQIIGKLFFIFNISFILMISCYHNKNYQNRIDDILNMMIEKSQIYIVIVISAWVFKMLIFFLAFFKYKMINQKASCLYNKVFTYYTILKEVDYLVSVFLLVLQWKHNVPMFLASIFFNLNDIIYNGNYHDRKLPNYIGSPFHYIIFRILIIIHHIFAVISFWQYDKEVFNVSLAICIPSLFFWYIKYGNYLHINKTMMIMGRVYIALHILILYTIVYKKFEQKDIIFQRSKFQLGFLFLVVYISLYNNDQSNKYQVIHQQKVRNIKEYERQIFDQLQSLNHNDSKSKIIEMQLYGIIQQHRNSCSNINCRLKYQYIYDVETKNHFEATNNKHFKEQILKQCINCLYQDVLCSNEGRNKQIMLDYMQFLYNCNPNVFIMANLLQKIKGYSLNIIDKIKVTRYELFLEYKIKGVNDILYQNNLHFQKLIYQEGIIKGISIKINHFIKENIKICNLLMSEEIKIQQIIDPIVQNEKLITQIDSSWKQIEQSIDKNIKFRYLYSAYLLFIKNQKLKQKIINQILTGMKRINSQSSNKTQQNELKLQNHKNPSIVYDEKTFSFKCSLKNNNLFIMNVSKSFNKFTGYSQDQIAESDFSILLLPSLKEKHSQIISQWLIQGRLMDQHTYNHQVTELVTKNKINIPVIKYYRSIYTIENGLQFICFIYVLDTDRLLLLNEQPELIITKINQVIDDQSSQYQQIPKIQLKNENNPFLREQQNQIQADHHIIRKIIILTRLISLFVIALVLLSNTLTQNNSKQILAYSQQFVNFMSVYRFPIAFNVNYLKRYTNIGNASYFEKRILTFKTNTVNIAKNSKTLKTLFDKNLNKPNNYSSNMKYPNYPVQQYDQIDIFHKVISSMATLGLPANRRSSQYINFTRFFIPGFTNLVNNSRYQLHYNFENIINRETNRQILFIINFSLFYIILILYSGFQLKKFVNSLHKVHSLICQIPKTYSQANLIYFMKLKAYFLDHFQFQYQNAQLSKELSQELSTIKYFQQNNIAHQVNLNKKSKKIQQEKTMKKQKKILFFGFFSSLFILCLISFMFKNSISSCFDFYQFQKQGFAVERYYATVTLVMIGVLERLSNSMYPNELIFLPQLYKTYIQQMKSIGNIKYQLKGFDDGSQSYFIKRFNYFYGNPCRYNSKLLVSLELSIKQCQSVANGTFKTGLSSFFRYCYKQSIDYIFNNKTMILSQIDQFTMGSLIANNYMTEEIQEWILNMEQKIKNLRQYVSNFSLIIIMVSILFHLIVNEILLKWRLKYNYERIKICYSRIIPELMLQKQKLFAQEFIKEGLLPHKD